MIIGTGSPGKGEGTVIEYIFCEHDNGDLLRMDTIVTANFGIGRTTCHCNPCTFI